MGSRSDTVAQGMLNSLGAEDSSLGPSTKDGSSGLS